MSYNLLTNIQKLEAENHNLVYSDLQIFQNKVLEIFYKCDFDFSFTGGTALSLKYLRNHRKSYDLDFFGKFPINESNIFEIFEANLKEIDIEIIEIKDIYIGLKMKRYIVRCNINNNFILMKIEFVDDYFHEILFKNSINKIDSLESIYFRKIYTLTTFNSERLKDLIDLYHLNYTKSIIDFFNEDFIRLYQELIDKDYVFDNKVICKTLNNWLRHIKYNEHIVKNELEKYGSTINIKELDKLFSLFCTKLCYTKE